MCFCIYQLVARSNLEVDIEIVRFQLKVFVVFLVRSKGPTGPPHQEGDHQTAQDEDGEEARGGFGGCLEGVGLGGIVLGFLCAWCCFFFV